MAVSDSFDRADSGSLGANWTNCLGGFSIVSNEAQGTDFAHNIAAYTAVSWNNDQHAETVVSSSSDGGPAVRASATGGGQAYVATANIGTSACRIVLFSGGSETMLTDDFCPWAAGDVIGLDVVGTTLTVTKNGTTVQTHTDATIASGSAGIKSYNTTNHIASWSATGDIGGGGGGATIPRMALLGVG